MVQKLAALKFPILLLLAGIILSKVVGFSTPEPCSAHYCDDKVYPCPFVNCTDGKIPLKVPELCRCCPSCYKVNGKGIF